MTVGNEVSVSVINGECVTHIVVEDHRRKESGLGVVGRFPEVGCIVVASGVEVQGHRTAVVQYVLWVDVGASEEVVDRVYHAHLRLLFFVIQGGCVISERGGWPGGVWSREGVRYVGVCGWGFAWGAGASGGRGRCCGGAGYVRRGWYVGEGIPGGQHEYDGWEERAVGVRCMVHDGLECGNVSNEGTERECGVQVGSQGCREGQWAD